MSNNYKYDFKSKSKLKLEDFNPDENGKASREECDKHMANISTELADLQEWLYASRLNSVLIVLQGMDTSGKDGTIAHVMQSINPQGCSVASFKAPTPIELSHDFLWRVHQQAPEKGMITIFNRSHYEDVLITRVHGMVDKKTCERRYEHIKNFEEMLADNGTLIMKFFLNISKEEQEARLLAREQDDEKAWKLNVGDWDERRYWDEYKKAYEDAITATSTKIAPWYIVPADHKWYRNLVIAQTIVETLRPYKAAWKEELKELGEKQKAELKQMREKNGIVKNGKTKKK